MSTFKIDTKQLIDSGGKGAVADIRKMLNKNCEYIWDDRHEILLEKWPDGDVYQVIFNITCERKKVIRFDLTKPKDEEAGQ